MSTLPSCPQCHCEYTYEDGGLLICPECAHEWAPEAAPAPQQARVWKDAHGNVLQDGDAVTLVKDLKIKGSSAVVKVGTKAPPPGASGAPPARRSRTRPRSRRWLG
jgi:protein PhnA